MCKQNCHFYRKCSHLAAYDFSTCATARARPNQVFYVPASGLLRDLPHALDVRDQNIDAFCPACLGKTPPSSQGSQG